MNKRQDSLQTFTAATASVVPNAPLSTRNKKTSYLNFLVSFIQQQQEDFFDAFKYSFYMCRNKDRLGLATEGVRT